jgi:hypothetical protein
MAWTLLVRNFTNKKWRSMKQLKEQPTYHLNGYVYATEWNKYGAVIGLSIMAENNKEYNVFQDENSHGLKDFIWEFMEIEYVLLDNTLFGQWIQVICFSCVKIKLGNHRNKTLYEMNEKDEDYSFQNDFRTFIEHKKFDENEWNYRDAYYSIDKEI